MNILPKKRWHVRTRENIARVRRDEAQAAEEEKKRQERIELAEKEARTELLRAKAREKHGYIPLPKKESLDEPQANGHINFFYELERNEAASTKTNAEHEKESKAEREKEEMKIGYLTYLGQDTNELTGNVSWYNKIPERRKAEESEVGLKEKQLTDPLKDIRKYLDSDGVKTIAKPPVPSCSLQRIDRKRNIEKRKKHKKKKSKDERGSRNKKKAKKRRRRSTSSSSSSRSSCKAKKAKTTSSVDIQKLREERIQREKVERQRAAAALARLKGEPEPSNKTPSPPPDYTQKYSSQFNPHLARQNFSI